MDILFSFYSEFRTYNHLIHRIIGCTNYVHIHSQNREKIDLRALKYIFVGYSSTQRSYKCYHPSIKKPLYLLTLFLMNKNSISPDLIFRGRLKLRKIRIMSLPLLTLQLPHKDEIKVRETEEKVIMDNKRFGKVYSGCTHLNNAREQIQASEPFPKIAVSTNSSRKAPVDPITNFVSFHNFSHSHKNFLVMLNDIHILNNIFEA